MKNYLYQIRVTGILIENNKILIVKQKVSSTRGWSLPGGRLEHGETIEEGLIRELYEETGLNIKVIKLLYVCEKMNLKIPLIHMTFLLEKTSGKIKLSTNEFDENPISDVKMIPLEKLVEYGFSNKFTNIVLKGFKDFGSYKGDKLSIGL